MLAKERTHPERIMAQTQNDQSTDGHPIVAAVYDRFTRYAEKNIFPEHRRYLARDLHGVVLDLGVGTGAMFPYFKEAVQRDAPFGSMASNRIHTCEPAQKKGQKISD